MFGCHYRIDYRRLLTDSLHGFFSPQIIYLTAVFLLCVDTFCPVVCRNIIVSFHHVSRYIESSPFMQGRIPVVVRTIVFSHIIESTNTNLGYTVTDTVCFLTRISSRSRFIIIVYNIYILIFGSVTALSCPVIEYIIPDIDILIKLCAGARAQTRNTAFAMCYQVMVIGSFVSTPVSSVAMCTLAMNRYTKCLSRDAPLHGRVLHTVHRETFIHTPAH